MSLASIIPLFVIFLILGTLSASGSLAPTRSRPAIEVPLPFTVRSGAIRHETDDGNSDDEQPNQPAKMSRDLTKIVERFGDCRDRQRHKCLWYKMQVHTKRTQNGRDRIPRSMRMKNACKSAKWKKWLDTAASPEDRAAIQKYSGASKGQTQASSQNGWKVLAGQTTQGGRKEWLKQSARQESKGSKWRELMKRAADNQDFKKFTEHLKRHMKKNKLNAKKSAGCLDRHLIEVERDDPKFMEYMRKRFYLLSNARSYVRGMKAKMHGLLKLHQEHECKESTKAMSGGSKKLIAHIDKLLRTHREQRTRVQHKHCHAVIVHFLHDVDRVLNHMQKKQASYEDMMKSWLRLSYQQKQKLYRILLANQLRDMNRVLRLRSLKAWYAQKLHLLDLQTRQRLQQIIRALKVQDAHFQDALWKRLKHLQKSSDEWTRHEATYKKVLMDMSRQQQYLLKLNTKQGKELCKVTDFIKNVPKMCAATCSGRRQEMSRSIDRPMAGSMDRSMDRSIGGSMDRPSQSTYRPSRSVYRPSRSMDRPSRPMYKPSQSTYKPLPRPMGTDKRQDECDEALPADIERLQKSIEKQLREMKIQQLRDDNSTMGTCSIKALDKTLSKPLNDDDKKKKLGTRRKMVKRVKRVKRIKRVKRVKKVKKREKSLF